MNMMVSSVKGNLMVKEHLNLKEEFMLVFGQMEQKWKYHSWEEDYQVLLWLEV